MGAITQPDQTLTTLSPPSCVPYSLPDRACKISEWPRWSPRFFEALIDMNGPSDWHHVDASAPLNAAQAGSWRVAPHLGANTHRGGKGPEDLHGYFLISSERWNTRSLQRHMERIRKSYAYRTQVKSGIGEA